MCACACVCEINMKRSLGSRTIYKYSPVRCGRFTQLLYRPIVEYLLNRNDINSVILLSSFLLYSTSTSLPSRVCPTQQGPTRPDPVIPGSSVQTVLTDYGADIRFGTVSTDLIVRSGAEPTNLIGQTTRNRPREDSF